MSTIQGRNPRDDCPICASRETVWVSETEADTYKFSNCRNCNFVFLNPMPSRDELSELYETNTYEITQDWYPKSASRIRRALGRSLRLLPHICRKEVLDVGCGGGFMTEAMRICGARASGVDINPVAIAYARNRFAKNSFFCEDFDAFLERKLVYDFVYCSDLLEHIGDLDYMMSFFCRVVRLGGRIYINTPDYDHPKVPPNLKDWDVFGPPYHVQFFNFQNAGLLFDEFGFRITKRVHHPKPGFHFFARKME